MKGAPAEEALTGLNCNYYACLGDGDGFFSWACKAIDQRVLEPENMRYAPWLDKVRGDARYADLLKGLPA